MSTQPTDLTPESDETSPSAAAEPEINPDELRYAPPLASDEPALTPSDSDAEPVEAALTFPEEQAPLPDDTLWGTADPNRGSLDIEAALAAVSSLSDMLAEQEAAEQARLAQIEADEQAAAERQARVEHPELFFPVPPLTTMRRGQMTSVIPAALLILLGAWLTFATTTASTAPEAGLIQALVLGGLVVVLLARWLTSGRWARGSLFMGLTLLLVGVGLLYLSLTPPESPGLAQGWPLLLAAVGAALLLTALLGYPPDRRLILPGLMLIAAGAAGLLVTLSVLDSALVAAVAPVWPAALAVIVVLALLPLVFRQRG